MMLPKSVSPWSTGQFETGRHGQESRVTSPDVKLLHASIWVLLNVARMIDNLIGRLLDLDVVHAEFGLK